MGQSLMFIVNVLPLISGVLALTMAGVVLSSDKKHSNRYSFAIFAIGMGLWSLFISVYSLSDDLGLAKISAHIYYAASALLIYGFLLFSMIFKGLRWKKPNRWIFVLSAIFPAVVITMSLWPDVLFTMTGHSADHRSVVLHDVPYLVFSTYFMLYAVLALDLLYEVYKYGRKSVRHEQVKFILIGMVLSLPGGVFFNLALPYFGNYELISIGPIFVFPIVLLTFYAMTKHSLFSIRMAVLRTTGYTLALATLGIIYFLLSVIVSSLLTMVNSDIRASVDPVGLLLAMMLMFMFQPVRAFFDSVTEKIFLRKTYNTADFIGRLSRTLTSTTDLKLLLVRAAEEISDQLRSEQAFFVLTLDKDDYVTGGTAKHRSFSDHDKQLIHEHLRKHGNSIIATNLLPDKSSVKTLLERSRVGILLPLGNGESLLGYLALGEHRTDGYTSRDLRVLAAVADELYIAIQNAISARELNEVNMSLQERIDEATDELRRSNEKLLKLDEAKDEFVSMASHQLRTPLTSVKGYIDMVLEGDAGKITSAQRKLLEEAFVSSERMVHLINDFLNVSRLQTGKFVIDKSTVDLSVIVAQEVKSLKTTASSRNLKLHYKAPRHFPLLELDEGKIRQVIMNLIDNAIYYSRPSTTVEVVLNSHGGEVVFEVHDHGIGVSKAEQKNLFTKFFRASNARRQRPDGTGVGLFLAKKVIDAHHGQMIFFSREGEGSVFGFRLPVKKLQVEQTDDRTDN